MEKTAIEWLVEELTKNGHNFKLYKKEIEQAKKIEKNQIENAYDSAKYLSSGNNYNGEKYYKDTFSN